MYKIALHNIIIPLYIKSYRIVGKLKIFTLLSVKYNTFRILHVPKIIQ